MKSTLNNACISALLCGAVIIAIPAFAAGGVGSGNGHEDQHRAKGRDAFAQ